MVRASAKMPIMTVMQVDIRLAILTSIDWKNGKTLLLPSDRKSDIFHRMAPLRMLYIMTLICFLKVTKFEMCISGKGWELAINCHVWLYICNQTIAIAVLRDLDLHCQGKTFSCYALAIKNFSGSICRRQIYVNLMASPWNCSCCNYSISW